MLRRWAAVPPGRRPRGPQFEYYLASPGSTRASLSQLQALNVRISGPRSPNNLNVQIGRPNHTKRKLRIGKRTDATPDGLQTKRAVSHGGNRPSLQKRGVLLAGAGALLLLNLDRPVAV